VKGRQFVDGPFFLHVVEFRVILLESILMKFVAGDRPHLKEEIVKKVLLLLAMLVVMAAAPAHAGIKMSLMGGVSYGGLNSATVSDPLIGDVTTKGSIDYIGGATLGIGLGQKADLEFGGLYLRRKKSDATVSVLGISTSTSVTIKYAHIPAGFRFYMGRVLSLYVGGFYDKGLDEGLGNTYGASGALRLAFGGNVKFFVEPRFNYELNNEGGGAKYKEVLGLAGLQFNFGK
jgi:hypothetical protein